MKKTSKAKLELNKDVLKRLTNTELSSVMGGSDGNGGGGDSADSASGSESGSTDKSGVGTRAGLGATTIC